MKPKLLLRFGVCLVRYIPHDPGEVTCILVHFHGSLSHIADLFYFVDDPLSGDVVLTKGFSDLLPRYVCRILVGITVVIPPISSCTLQLVCS